MIDLGIHLVDLALWMLGFPRSARDAAAVCRRRPLAARRRGRGLRGGAARLGPARRAPRLLVEPAGRARRRDRGALLRHARRRALRERRRLVLRLRRRALPRHDARRCSASRRTTGAAAPRSRWARAARGTAPASTRRSERRSIAASPTIARPDLGGAMPRPDDRRHRRRRLDLRARARRRRSRARGVEVVPRDDGRPALAGAAARSSRAGADRRRSHESDYALEWMAGSVGRRRRAPATGCSSSSAESSPTSST